MTNYRTLHAPPWADEDEPAAPPPRPTKRYRGWPRKAGPVVVVGRRPWQQHAHRQHAVAYDSIGQHPQNYTCECDALDTKAIADLAQLVAAGWKVHVSTDEAEVHALRLVLRQPEDAL